MWCINLTNLYRIILAIVIILNFIITLIIIFLIPGFIKTANKVFRYRCYGNYNDNAIDDIDVNVTKINVNVTKDIDDLRKDVINLGKELIKLKEVV